MDRTSVSGAVIVLRRRWTKGRGLRLKNGAVSREEPLPWNPCVVSQPSSWASVCLRLRAAVAPGTHLPRSHFPRFPIPNTTRHRNTIGHHNTIRLHNTSQVRTRIHTNHGRHRTHMSRAGLQTRLERHDQTLTDERRIRITTTNPSCSGGFGALSPAPCSAARN